MNYIVYKSLLISRSELAKKEEDEFVEFFCPFLQMFLSQDKAINY